MSAGRISVFLHIDVFRITAEVGKHIYHILILCFRIVSRPFLFVKRIYTAFNHLRSSLVGLGKVFFGGLLPAVFIESNHTHSRLGTQTGQTASYRFIILSYTARIEHGFRLEGQCYILVAVTALGTIGHHQFDGLVIVSQNLIPSFFLTGTGDFQITISGILDDLCHQRNSTKTTGHSVEDRGTHVIGFAQIMIVSNLGIRTLVLR